MFGDKKKTIQELVKSEIERVQQLALNFLEEAFNKQTKEWHTKLTGWTRFEEGINAKLANAQRAMENAVASMQKFQDLQVEAAAASDEAMRKASDRSIAKANEVAKIAAEQREASAAHQERVAEHMEWTKENAEEHNSTLKSISLSLESLVKVGYAISEDIRDLLDAPASATPTKKKGKTRG